MKILAIDSSRKTVSFVIWDQETQSTIVNQSQQSQSSTLLNSLIESCNSTQFNIQELNLLLVSIGPGSFTGIRNALSICKTLATQLELPFIAFNNFELLRFQHKHTTPLAIKAGTNDYFISLDNNYADLRSNFYSLELDPSIPIYEADLVNFSELMIDYLQKDPSILKKQTKDYTQLKPYYLREPSIGSKIKPATTV